MNLSRRAHPRVRVRERLDRLRKQDGEPTMIAITQENTRNLPTSVKTTTEMVPFKLRKEAVGEAQLELGPVARPGFEFDVSKCDGSWRWRRIGADECMAKLATNGAQLKANGGKKSLLAQAVAIEAKNGTVPQEVLAGAFEEVAANIAKPATVKDAVTAAIDAGLTPKQFAKIAEDVAEALDTTKDANGIPAFLKREADTAEQKKARIEKHKKTTGPGRVIKNPPNVKKATKASIRDPSGLASQQRIDGLKAGSSGATLVDTVCREEGATNEELCKAVGWKECLPAMKKYAAKAGITITTKKEKGESTRYFGTRKD